jgi:predicted dehydrogenase
MMATRKPDLLLDAWRDPDSQVRIQVDGWFVRQGVTGQFVEFRRDPRIIWNYLRRVGPVAVWRKVRSRTAEARRNHKIAGLGWGRVVDAPGDAGLTEGQCVLFFATNHSDDWPRVVVDMRLVRACRAAGNTRVSATLARLPDALLRGVGWRPESGASVDPALSAALDAWATEVEAPTSEPAERGPVERSRTRRPGRPAHQTTVDSRPTAVLVGYGNYAKTQILPVVRRHLTLEAIHEIDPDQIGTAAALPVTLDTAPSPADDARFDAWFVAGYHHTHTALAVRALRDGAYAVVEKPLVTTSAQLNVLTEATTAHPGRTFACFHRRYSRVHEWAVQDLAVASGDPIDMFSLVFEIPLPPLHWYEWPNSGGRMISNGCHWLDYFLFVNGNSPVTDAGARRLRGDDVLAWATLENGAQMSLSLTDTGSARLGVRDVVDLRAGSTTVRIVDASVYEAETSTRILRRRQVNPMDAYARMYETICRSIAAGGAADGPDTLRSSALMLEMEAQLQ